MDVASQIDALVELAERLGIEIRREHLGGGGGGLCRIKGKQVLFLDLDADPATRLDQCAIALSSFPAIQGVYLSPEIRERLDGKLG
jgi:hypothetical protein